ncbi:hypothetical protein JCM8547_008069 [Rhodosporidiobolus lusitaniae]
MTSLASSARSRSPPLASNAEWIHRRFQRAVDIIQTLPKGGPINTNYDEKLVLYSAYKQATEGDIMTSRPGLLDVLGRAKWDAWNKRKGLSQMEAERHYVEALIKILKGYSDRTQAVELLRELETFALDPRLAAGHGSIAPSRTDDLHSSDSSSTASCDDRRSMPPPPLPSSSRHQHMSRSALSRAVPAPASSAGARYRRPQPASPRGAPAPADTVAPPLPGYGPPRTRADSIRRSRRRRRHSRGSYSSSRSESDSGTGSDSEEDTRQYHPAPSHRSFAQQQQFRTGPPSLPPHPSQLAPPLSHHPARPQPLQPMPSSLRSIAGSYVAPPSLGSAGGGGQAQQVAVAYPPGYLPQRVVPLTAGNLLRTTVTAPSPPVASPIAATPPPAPGAASSVPPPALDAALERIQTSLTALHERLALLESAPTPSSSSTLTSSSSPLAFIRELLLRILVLLRLRRSPRPPPPGSPSLSRTTALSTFQPPSALTLTFHLVAAILRTARRAAADLVVAFAVVAVLGRMRGVDVPRMVGGWVVSLICPSPFVGRPTDAFSPSSRFTPFAPLNSPNPSFTLSLSYSLTHCNAFRLRISRIDKSVCARQAGGSELNEDEETSRFVREELGPDTFHLQIDGADRLVVDDATRFEAEECTYEYEVALANSGSDYNAYISTPGHVIPRLLAPLFPLPVQLSLRSGSPCTPYVPPVLGQPPSVFPLSSSTSPDPSSLPLCTGPRPISAPTSLPPFPQHDGLRFRDHPSCLEAEKHKALFLGDSHMRGLYDVLVNRMKSDEMVLTSFKVANKEERTGNLHLVFMWDAFLEIDVSCSFMDSSDSVILSTGSHQACYRCPPTSAFVSRMERIFRQWPEKVKQCREKELTRALLRREEVVETGGSEGEEGENENDLVARATRPVKFIYVTSPARYSQKKELYDYWTAQRLGRWNELATEKALEAGYLRE